MGLVEYHCGRTQSGCSESTPRFSLEFRVTSYHDTTCSSRLGLRTFCSIGTLSDFHLGVDLACETFCGD